jgi:hypothetical protein
VEINKGFAELQKARRERVELLLREQPARMNGLEVPMTVPRFFGAEMAGFSEILWGFFGDSLDEIAKSFEESDTDGIFRHRAYDLDLDEAFVPVFKVERWVPVES